jgi:hypothetical protein
MSGCSSGDTLDVRVNIIGVTNVQPPRFLLFTLMNLLLVSVLCGPDELKGL